MQATQGQYGCDQIFTLNVQTDELKLVSTGQGRTTCSYFTADGQHIIFSSTHETLGPDCPPPPDMSHGYVWPVYPYDIYERDLASGGLTRLTDSPGYDAESTIDWHTGWVYFTSSRDGDLDIYRMQLLPQGGVGPAQRLTDAVGYDGGPFVSYDGRTVVDRRDSQDTPEQQATFKALLGQGLVKPTQLELWALPLDGSHAPVRITYGGEFDGFPMFSPDGKRLAWCSNRNHAKPHETNVFVADWKGIDWSTEE
jgi:Tol biopolymer transport system component